MENPVTSDIFKFMALRPPKNFDHERDVVTIIRDNRIKDRYLPDEVHTVSEDEAKFGKSVVGNYVFSRVKEYLDEVSLENNIVLLGDAVAENVRGQFSVDERTGRPGIDEFVVLIKQHLTTFQKDKLIVGLDQIVKKHFPDYSGIRDYVEVISDLDKSSFCFDYEHLFDRLYALYVCKRLYRINLEYVIDGLKALHVIRFLKLDLDRRQQSDGCLLALRKLFHRKRNDENVESSDTTRTDCAERQVTEDGAIIPEVAIETREDLAHLFSATPYIHQLFACLLAYYKPFNDIRPIGIGDLLVVKQFLCKYEAGEIAHVENVLKGESKERSHRRLDKTEDIFSTQTEKSEETERDLQTTNRYELKVETESTIQNDLNAELAASVSGSYGTVQYSVNAGISYSLSTSDSRRSSNNFAKDIVDRSLTRVQKRTREERTTKKTNEIEEINKHNLNNTNGSGHITGIYRWLDKHYKAQVYNYGKRLMFEFIIPEPAAFIQAAFERNKKKQHSPNEPQPPKFPVLVIDQISNETVDEYAKGWNIPNLDPAPADTMPVRSQALTTADAKLSVREFTLDIPPGYRAESAHLTGSYVRPKNPTGLFVAIGKQSQKLEILQEDISNPFIIVDNDYPSVGGLREKLSIVVLTWDVFEYAFNVVVTVQLTTEKKREWQIETYTKIMNAYQRLLAAYNSEFSEYQSKLEGYNVSQGIVIQGRNPGINQNIIKTELKKHCITMIAKQFDIEKTDDIEFNAMQTRDEQIHGETTVVTETKKVTQTIPVAGTTVTVTETTIRETTTPSSFPIPFPAINIPEAREEGTIIQFLEQAFEWPQISYLLYPYFWGRMPDRWFEAQAFYDEEDPLYAKFLQAGSVRVLVAAHPAYEVAVMHYLCTHKPWNGGPAPGIHNPLYIPIHEELRNQQDDLNGAEPYGDSWDVVVPTSVVYLQDSSDLPSYDCNPPVKKK
jgi:hypothetical protein